MRASTLAIALIACTACSSATKPAAAPFVPDPALQATRLEFIEKIKAAGLVQKIETPGSLPRVWVTPAFLLADFQAKEDYCHAIFGYYFPDPSDTLSGNHLRLFHSISGKEIGRYDRAGLVMN